MRKVSIYKVHTIFHYNQKTHAELRPFSKPNKTIDISLSI